MTLEVKVVLPTVVSKVELSEVTVETTGLVTVVWGAEVAPATPETPETVVVPVVVMVDSPLVKVEVNSLVVIAVASPEAELAEPPAPAPPEGEPEETMVTEVTVLMAELTVVITVEVVTAEAEPEAPEPEPEPGPYVVVSAGLLVTCEMRELTAEAGGRLTVTPASAQYCLPQLMAVSASLSEQIAMEQSRMP